MIIPPMQQNMIDYLRKKAQGVPDVGNPPPPAVAPNPMTHGSQPPNANRKFYELSPAEQQQRTQWMVDEASRIIASRQQKPDRPFTPQYPTPEPFNAQNAERDRLTGIASQIAQSMAESDPK